MTRVRKRPRKRGPYTDPNMVAAIENLATILGPMKIHADLVKQFGDRAPNVRTVQRIAKAALAVDSSEPWTLATADSHTARVVLDALKVIIQDSNGAVRSISSDLAKWVGRVANAAPGLEPRLVLQTARDYQRRSARGESLERLDWYLAGGPPRFPSESLEFGI